MRGAGGSSAGLSRDRHHGVARPLPAEQAGRPILFLDGEGTCTAFEGTYEEFAVSQEAPKELQTPTKPALPTPKEVSAAPEKPSSNGQKFSKNELAKLKGRCEFLEQEIQRIESLIESNTSQLSDPEVARDFVQFKQLTDRHEDLSTELSQLYQEWEKSLKACWKTPELSQNRPRRRTRPRRRRRWRVHQRRTRSHL